MNTVILLKLLLAHILTDFVFQTDKWVKAKKDKGTQSIYFWIHVLLSGVLTYILLMHWTNWFIPMFIIVTHAIIDYWKIHIEKRQIINKSQTKNAIKRFKYFLIDQSLHLFVILIAWFYFIEDYKVLFEAVQSILESKKYLAIMVASILMIWPAGRFIEIFTERLRHEFSPEESLSNAGKYIGILERLLVLILVFVNQYIAIGFLIAGKSILRVSKEKDKDARKKTEYVLIGTLISFAIAILTGVITLKFIGA